MPATLIKAREAAEVVSADALMTKIAELETDARRIAAAAEAAGDLKTALTGVRELARMIDLLARLTGRFDGGADRSTRATVVINFPTLSAEDQKAVENAQVIDLPPAARRLLQRPSDGRPL